MIDHDVVVVGASVGGFSTVEALRRRGFAGSVALVGEEEHLPYDRPPLSKGVLTSERTLADSFLTNRDQLASWGVSFLPGLRAAGLDVAGRRVRLHDGRSLGFGTVVLSTGMSPRVLPGWDGVDGVHVLHDAEQCARLRAELVTGRSVVVVGAGVLGSEIAAAAVQLGATVTLVDKLSQPLVRQVGPGLGRLVRDLHESHGIATVMPVDVLGPVVIDGRATGIRLAGGVVTADVVVLAVGGRPNTDWLAGSGLRIEDGVVCDEYLRAAPHVHAVGDVARWRVGTSTVRAENRTNAFEQAQCVAAAICGEPEPYTAVPYYWTKLHGTRIQVAGAVPAGAQTEPLDGELDADRFVAAARLSGEIVGVVGWNHPRGFLEAKALIPTAR